jgi:hypothetical protein
MVSNRPLCVCHGKLHPQVRGDGAASRRAASGERACQRGDIDILPVSMTSRATYQSGKGLAVDQLRAAARRSWSWTWYRRTAKALPASGAHRCWYRAAERSFPSASAGAES